MDAKYILERRMSCWMGWITRRYWFNSLCQVLELRKPLKFKETDGRHLPPDRLSRGPVESRLEKLPNAFLSEVMKYSSTSGALHDTVAARLLLEQLSHKTSVLTYIDGVRIQG